VRIAYRGQGARARLLLGPEWRLTPADELLRRLARLFGEGRVRMVYGVARPAAPAIEPQSLRRRA
jgi:hypothetical protein